MSGLQLLSAYLAEVAKEILRVVEDAVAEYREEAARARRENHSLRSQLRDVLLLDARAEWPTAGSIHVSSFSPEQLSLSENSTSAVTPPTRRSVLTSQVTVVQREPRQVIVSAPEPLERKPGISTERTGDGPRPTALTPASVRVKEEPEERDVTELHERETEERGQRELQGTETEERGQRQLQGTEMEERGQRQLQGTETEERGQRELQEAGVGFVKEEPEVRGVAELSESETEERGQSELQWTELRGQTELQRTEERGQRELQRTEERGQRELQRTEERGQRELQEAGYRVKGETERPAGTRTERPELTVDQVAQLPVSSRPNPPRCPRCSDTFASPSELLLHLHQQRKTYCCDFCCKSFSQSADLRRHHRTHTGERPHRCGYCSKAFSQRGNLRRHLRIHTGERPYACPLCNRRFSDGDTLKKHKRTHSAPPGGSRRCRGGEGRPGMLSHR